MPRRTSHASDTGFSPRHARQTNREFSVHSFSRSGDGKTFPAIADSFWFCSVSPCGCDMQACMSIRSRPTAPTTLNQTNANLILSHTISSAAFLAPLALVEAYSKQSTAPASSHMMPPPAPSDICIFMSSIK